MRKKAVYIFGLLFLVFVLTYLIWSGYLGPNITSELTKSPAKEVEKASPAEETKWEVSLNPFILSDPGGDFLFTSENNFNFEFSEYQILRPVSKDIITGIAELQLYFGANEARRIKILGWYASAEDNSSGFPNLGLARANSIKEYFIIQGIPSSRIDLKGIQKNDLRHHKKTLYGPVQFQISLGTSTSEENKK